MSSQTQKAFQPRPKPVELNPATLQKGQQVHVLYCGRFMGTSIKPLEVVTVVTVGRKWVTLSNRMRVSLTGDGMFGAASVNDPAAKVANQMAAVDAKAWRGR